MQAIRIWENRNHKEEKTKIRIKTQSPKTMHWHSFILNSLTVGPAGSQLNWVTFSPVQADAESWGVEGQLLSGTIIIAEAATHGHHPAF